ncbi:tetratricopeptide repeat protein [Shinella sedimenti]|uniref:Sel1 repeat family protein n=1 Tax=Shinella sedimenti TaxID=2919913 RepID=A0ABT0CPR0_9HYPH|nr:tetratricopeptide repeat protein [Shinella sedimenti]MCJ8150553.1 sel1 repeat family protein [Shinella sedimenti]
MIRVVLSQACRIVPVALLATGVFACAPAFAQVAKKGPAVTAGDNGKEDRPTAAEPATPADEGKQADGPSGGLGVLDRMGAELPELPAEKPFTGKVDEAYGAFQRGRYLTAMELALPRAQLGDRAAQTLVAEILDRGLGVKRNRDQAMFWYEQAANGGDPTGMFKYAVLLMERSRSKDDRKKADELMKKAADLGNPSAQFNYAQVLVADSPGEKGLREALPYYEKSAEQGIADAQYALSQIYISLKDLPDEKKNRAREWLLRAARAGYDTAQLDLGMWLVNGTAGERDYEAGFNWLKRAAEGGNAVAQSKLAQLYIHAIGTKSDPVEAAKWFVLARRAGLSDPSLEDFYLGLEESQQKAAITAANKFRTGS